MSYEFSSDLTMLVEEIRQIFSSTVFLSQKEVDADKTFTELGMDSILGFEFIEKINERFGCSVSTAILYKHKKINQLAEYLQKNMENLGNRAIKE